MQLDDGLSDLELLKWVLSIDDLQFSCIASLQPVADVDNHTTDHVKNFKVMVLKLHLHVESCELTQMPVSVGVFCAEYWANLIDSLQITTECHLLVKLR